MDTYNSKIFSIPEISPSSTPTPTPTPTPTNTPTPTITPTVTPTLKPVQTPKVFDFTNECSVITLFPMTVECVVTLPSPESADGIASLSINGGTPPYTISWDNGNVSPTIYNLPAGSYSAIIVDYYKDFTANTTCVLTGSTPVVSPTPTPTPTQPFVEYQLCMELIVKNEKSFINFNPSGSLYNGKPSWINNTGNYSIVWSSSTSQWVLSSSTPFVYSVFSTNSSYPPTNNWNIIPTLMVNDGVSVSEGSCGDAAPVGLKLLQQLSPSEELSLFYTKNVPNCGCDGGLTLRGSGGVPPYSYSVDNGITYKKFPVFTNLCSGNYTLKITDSNGNLVVDNAILPNPIAPVTYKVSLNTVSNIISTTSNLQTTEYKTTISVLPSLPDNIIITFDLFHTNSSQSSPNFSSSTVSTNTELSVNSISLSADTIETSTGVTFNRLIGCQNNTVYLNSIGEVWNGLSFDNQTLFEIITVTTVYRNENIPCYIGSSSDTYQISNLSIQGCQCCKVST